jgi:IclR family transcriptional regulator, KDG regulon repressor
MSSTVDKALTILNFFLSEEHSSFYLMEICEALKLDKSTAFRMITTLEKQDFVVHNPETRKYELGPKILQLSNRIHEDKNIVQAALTYMHLLRDETGETVSLQSKMGFSRVCVKQVPGIYEIRWVVEVGKSLPLYAGSSGKVLLAYSSDNYWDKFFKWVALTPFTPNTITDERLLRETLRIIRTQGYSYCSNERVSDVSGIAVPIFNQFGEVSSVLAVSGPSYRLNHENMHNYANRLKEIAQQVSYELGFRKEMNEAAQR